MLMTRTKHLTGLDPVGPGFTNQSCDVCFCKGDALFVEAIHTNGKPVTSFGNPNGNGRNMPSYGDDWVRNSY
jgi:hypothetical protein